MDAKRFDALAKALISETNRRRTLGGLLSGALGALGLAAPDDAAAAKSGKCKKECDPLCEFCKKGTCRKKNGIKRCRKGKCKPERNGTPCASVGGTCQKGNCVCPDGRENCGANCCINNQICENGACTCPPGLELCNGVCLPICAPNVQARNPNTCICCFVAGLPCTNTTPEGGRVPQPNATCCSQLCLPVGASGTGGACAPGAEGTPCNVNANCTSNDCEPDGLCDA